MLREVARTAMVAARKWPGALAAADRATEPYGDVVSGVMIGERGGLLQVLLRVHWLQWLLHPLRVSRSVRAVEAATVKWRGRRVALSLYL